MFTDLPVITKFSEDSVIAVINSNLRLDCVIQGVPTPDVSWTQSTKPVISEVGGRVEILTNGSLAIQGVTLTDGGVYMCVATNILGTTRLEITMLNIEGVVHPLYTCHLHVCTPLAIIYIIIL